MLLNQCIFSGLVQKLSVDLSHITDSVNLMKLNEICARISITFNVASQDQTLIMNLFARNFLQHGKFKHEFVWRLHEIRCIQRRFSTNSQSFRLSHWFVKQNRIEAFIIPELPDGPRRSSPLRPPPPPIQFKKSIQNMSWGWDITVTSNEKIKFLPSRLNPPPRPPPPSRPPPLLPPLNPPPFCHVFCRCANDTLMFTPLKFLLSNHEMADWAAFESSVDVFVIFK